MRSLTLKLIPVLALFIGISGEVFAQSPDSCREESVSADEATCGGKYPCLKMTLCGLIGFVHDRANNSVTGYFVDATPESKTKDQYPEGADLSLPDLASTFPAHWVELTVKQGMITEYDVSSSKTSTCTATEETFCTISAKDRSPKDLDLYFLPQGAMDPRPNIDMSMMLDETKLRASCPRLATEPSYFKRSPSLDLNSPFLEARIELDRGTSIFSAPTACENPAQPNYGIAQAMPQKSCSGASIKLAEKLQFSWSNAQSTRFILASRASGSMFVLEPSSNNPNKDAVIVSFTNESRGDTHHDAPFRWLYRLTTNNNAMNHFFLPHQLAVPCQLLGSKCPMLLLESP